MDQSGFAVIDQTSNLSGQRVGTRPAIDGTKASNESSCGCTHTHPPMQITKRAINQRTGLPKASGQLIIAGGPCLYACPQTMDRHVLDARMGYPAVLWCRRN